MRAVYMYSQSITYFIGISPLSA